MDPKKLKVRVNRNLVDINKMGQITPGFSQAGDRGLSRASVKRTWDKVPDKALDKRLNKWGNLHLGQHEEEHGQQAERRGCPLHAAAGNPQLGAVPRLAPQFRKRWRSWRRTSSCCWQGWGLDL